MRLIKTTRMLVVLGLVVMFTGCVKNPNPVHPMDPYEKYNRRIFVINTAIDRGIVQPVALLYHFMLPPPIRAGVKNIFANVKETNSLVNHLLQGNIKGSLINANRLIINTVFGIGGLFDVASRLGLHPLRTSFDETLGVWGARPKYYLMLPIFGPTTDRGAVGVVIDAVPLDPYSYLDNWYLSFGLVAGNYVQLRESGLAAGKMMYDSFDPYVFMRDAYFQSMKLGTGVSGNVIADEVQSTGDARTDDGFEYVLD